MQPGEQADDDSSGDAGQPPPQLVEMGKNRLEAFSDGVIAIAITLLVLEIKVPQPSHEGMGLAAELGRQWPSYAAYVVSFLTVGIVWINHHATIRRLRFVDHTVLVLNLLLLLVIGVLPWTTALLASYLREPDGDRLTAAIYGGVFFLLTAVFYVMQRHILYARKRLLHEHITDAHRVRIDRVNRIGLIPYAVATAVAAFSAYATLGICALTAVYYALPSTIYETARGRTRN